MPKEKKYPFLKLLSYRIEFIAAKALGTLAYSLSVEHSSVLAAFFGRLAFYLLARKRKTALDNLAIAFPKKTAAERSQIAQKSFENAAISVTELFVMEKIVKTASVRFDLSETKHFDEAIHQNYGVILAISHLGAWECHEILATLKETPTMVIVKNLKNPFVNQEVTRLRALTTVIPYDKDRAIRGVFEYIKKGGMAAILLDQWAGTDGIWTPFFGKNTSTTTIAARFAQKTGAIIIPSFCIRVRPGYYKFETLPRIAVRNEGRDVEMEVTRQLNAILEEKIRQYPEQWIWGHRRWKEKPNQSRVQ